ncbi:Uncharacterised protein [Candidatus Tiddalikarchaeum anstoanum]|nr:Uncharacterised protein [Candidatus Tiddalikarchaeum anstoanum]
MIKAIFNSMIKWFSAVLILLSLFNIGFAADTNGVDFNLIVSIFFAVLSLAAMFTTVKAASPDKEISLVWRVIPFLFAGIVFTGLYFNPGPLAALYSAGIPILVIFAFYIFIAATSRIKEWSWRIFFIIFVILVVIVWIFINYNIPFVSASNGGIVTPSSTPSDTGIGIIIIALPFGIVLAAAIYVTRRSEAAMARINPITGPVPLTQQPFISTSAEVERRQREAARLADDQKAKLAEEQKQKEKKLEDQKLEQKKLEDARKVESDKTKLKEYQDAANEIKDGVNTLLSLIKDYPKDNDSVKNINNYANNAIRYANQVITGQLTDAEQNLNKAKAELVRANEEKNKFDEILRNKSSAFEIPEEHSKDTSISAPDTGGEPVKIRAISQKIENKVLKQSLEQAEDLAEDSRHLSAHFNKVARGE